MKRLSVRATIAVITFFIGIATVSMWLVKRHQPVIPEIEITRTESKAVTPQFLEVFSDFEYVGNGVSSESVPSHSIDSQPLPQTFEGKHQYIFHRRNPTDNDSLFNELQNRLRLKGIKILDAQGNLYAYADGLHFHILFQNGNYRGRIENRIDQQIASSRDASLRKRLFIDDYILTIEELKETPLK